MKALIVAFVTLVISLYCSSQKVDYISKLEKHRVAKDATLANKPSIQKIDLQKLKNSRLYIPSRLGVQQYFNSTEVIKRGGLFHKRKLQIPHSPSTAIQIERPIIQVRKRKEFV